LKSKEENIQLKEKNAVLEKNYKELEAISSENFEKLKNITNDLE